MFQSETHDVTERFLGFFKNYYRDEIGVLAQHYPKEKRSLHIDYADLYQYDKDLADDLEQNPEIVLEYAEEALHLFDLPADIDLSGAGSEEESAHVRVFNLSADRTFYPGGFSPTKRAGQFVAIEGQVSKRTSVDPKITDAAFECQRCGTMTYIPQTDGTFQEPHECQGCERQGPFRVNFDQSEFVDSQTVRVQEPPEISKGGDAASIDIEIEDDLVELADAGDKVVYSGVLHIKQKTNGNEKTSRFDYFLEANDMMTKETEFEDIEITPEDEEICKELAKGKDGKTIYELGRDSVAPGVMGYDPVKLAHFLQLIGGVRTRLPDGSHKRGDFHQLQIGDPSTGKSQMMDAVTQKAPKSVSVSGKGATLAGMTASAVQDDFGNSNEWTLEAGALVQANNGLVTIDELDKVGDEVANSMHEAMEQQRVSVNKAGINATLPSVCAILASANPIGGRWDSYKPVGEELNIEPALLQRFALIWKFEDRPDPDKDTMIADHILNSKDQAKRTNRVDIDTTDENVAEPDIDAEMFRKYVAYAKRVPSPVFESEAVKDKMRSSYVSLRGANGYDDDVPIPISPRKLDDIQRIAEAAAKAELSDVITEDHVDIAQQLVGESLRQFGMNEDGEYDADVVETGQSMPQKKRKETILQLVAENQPSEGGLPIGQLRDLAEEEGIDPDKVKDEVEALKKIGEMYESSPGAVRVFNL